MFSFKHLIHRITALKCSKQEDADAIFLRHIPHSEFRYGDVVCKAVLGDLPPLDELASQRIAEARLLYRDWTAYWSRHKQWSQAHVRAGWTNIVGLDLDQGRITRIACLSLDGRSDVTNNSTWLDDAVAAIINIDNLPMIFMPGNGTEQACTPRTLIVGDLAEFWPNRPNPPNLQAGPEEHRQVGNEEDPDTEEGM